MLRIKGYSWAPSYKILTWLLAMCTHIGHSPFISALPELLPNIWWLVLVLICILLYIPSFKISCVWANWKMSLEQYSLISICFFWHSCYHLYKIQLNSFLISLFVPDSFQIQKQIPVPSLCHSSNMLTEFYCSGFSACKLRCQLRNYIGHHSALFH